MGMTKCHHCGAAVSTDAERCPACGGRTRRVPWGALILGTVLCAGVVVWFWATL
jgi:RNA polymerase subunit RPABC4/transcription elongation factor Spt4